MAIAVARKAFRQDAKKGAKEGKRPCNAGTSGVHSSTQALQVGMLIVAHTDARLVVELLCVCFCNMLLADSLNSWN